MLIHTYDFSEEKNPNLQESDTIIPEYNDSGIQNFYAYLGTETGYSREWFFEFPSYSYIGFGSQPPVLILDSLYQIVPDSTLGYPQQYGFSGEAFDTIVKGSLFFSPALSNNFTKCANTYLAKIGYQQLGAAINLA